MTLTNDSIRSLLEIKDPNIKIDDVFILFSKILRPALLKHRYLFIKSAATFVALKLLVHNGNYISTITYTSDNASHPVLIKIVVIRSRLKFR